MELDVSENEGTATITVLGEQEKLKAASTALQDLLATYELENASVTFSASELRRAPELRRAALSEKMKALKTLQEQCPAYLGLGEKLEELRVLGTASDQRATLVRVMTLCDA